MSKILSFILCLVALNLWAQTDSSLGKIYRIDMNQKPTENKYPEQRHPTSDLILRILNINADHLPILIEYYEDAETIQMAKELTEELTYRKMKVAVQAADTTEIMSNPGKNNFTYRITDSLFIITAHPRNKL